jgi:GNAT superfamily N-acetyltransferase
MTEPELTFASEPADRDPGRSLVLAMEAEIVDIYRAFEQRPHDPVLDELATDGGALIVARVDGEPVGCAGLKRLDDDVAEIKRVYVEPAFRGRGIGRPLIAAIEGEARRLGYRRVRLDTGHEQPEARHIYETSGYRGIERFNDAPFAAFWFEKDL